MDMEKLKNNYQYFDNSYYIPAEITLSIKESPEFNIHIEEMYFDDIFHDNAPLDGKGWHGFTRDYLERVGGWEKTSEMDDLEEYLKDIKKYIKPKYEFERKETPEVLNLIIDFLTYAKQTGQTVVVDVA